MENAQRFLAFEFWLSCLSFSLFYLLGFFNPIYYVLNYSHRCFPISRIRRMLSCRSERGHNLDLDPPHGLEYR